MKNKPVIKKRYAILWIPVLYHKTIEPLYCAPGTETDRDHYNRYREYTTDEEGVIDLQQEIRFRDVPVSDEVKEDVFLNLTLHRAEERADPPFPEPEGDRETAPLKPIEKRSVTLEVFTKKEGILHTLDTLFLKCVETSNNGLFQYEYEYDPDKEHLLLDSNFDILHLGYHAVKGVYYKHEYHDHGADSITNPFCREACTSINSPDNPALIHYLELFETMFLADVELLKELEADITPRYKKTHHRLKALDILRETLKEEPKEPKVRELEKIEQERNQLLQQLQHYLKTYREINRKYAKIVGKQTYYQSLFYSRYNTLFRPVNPSFHLNEQRIKYLHQPESRPSGTSEGVVHLNLLPPANEKRKSVYKKAVNIRNALNFVTFRKKEIENVIHSITQYCNDAIINSIAQLTADNNATTHALKKLSEQNSQIIRSTHQTTGSLKKLTEEAETANRKANLFSKRSAWWAIGITLFFALCDLGYFYLSASGKTVEEIRKNQEELLRVGMESQQKQIARLDSTLRALEKALSELNPPDGPTPPSPGSPPPL